MQAGLLSREIKETGVPTLLQVAEGNIAGGDMREPPAGPARSETPSMCGNTLCGNREIPRPPAEERTAGRIGKSKDVSR